MHWSTTAGRRLLAALPLAVAAFTGSAAAAPGQEGVAATYGEPAWQGPIPSELRKSQQQLHQWLMANRATSGKAGANFAVTLTPQDRADIGQADARGNSPRPAERRLRVGVSKALDATVSFSDLGGAKGGNPAAREFGAVRTTGNGFVWTGIAHSKDASALRVHFKGVNLPQGAELYVYNSHGQAYGPYTGKGPLNDGDFWANTVNGATTYLQLHYTGPMDPAALNQLGFKVAHVGHLGPRFLLPRYTSNAETGEKAFCSYNASCVENASCFSSSDWGAIGDARGGVAHIQFVSGPYVYICSGGLLNDTDDSGQIPYFLTANHCVSKGREANSLEAFWQFSSSCGTCDDGLGSVPSTLGSSILESNRTSDYTLLQLSEQPPVGSVFMGWTSQEVAFTGGYDLYRISHPKGAPQAYSEHSVDTATGTCTTWPRGDWIYSQDQVGATEGGSSGSPVLNASGQVVGQLSGACGTNLDDVCDAQNNATVDGALAAYFGTVSQYLDPDGGGGGGGGGGTTDAHVDSITISTRSRGPWTNGVATVTVVDASGSPVANASVSGTFSGDVTGGASDTTDSNGEVVLESDRTRDAVSSFQFCVDDISGTDINYDSGANVESCDSL